MSVRLYDAAEVTTLGQIYLQAVRRLNLTGRGPTDEQLNDAFFAAHMANHAAFCATYHDWQRDSAGQFCPLDIRRWARESFALGKDELRAWVKDLRLLTYNAISNAGTNFLPERHRETLRRAELVILDYLAGLD